MSTDQTSDANLSILLVDDDEIDRESIVRMLRDDYDVLSFDCGREALGECARSTPDCALLDYLLPDVDGLKLLDQFVERKVPVILLTGKGNESVAVDAMKHGAEDYLVKGELTASGIRRSINNAIEKRALRERLQVEQQNRVEDERLKVMLQLAGNAVQDINQPLTSLIGYVELLQSKLEDPEKRVIYATRAMDAAQRTQKIVKQLQNIRLDDENGAHATSPTNIALTDLRILCLEKSDDDFALIEKALSGFDSVTLERESSVATAKDRLINHDFHLCLLDNHLTDGDGAKFLNMLRQESLTVPTIVITGDGDEMLASKLIQAGAYDYLPKQLLSAQSLSHSIKNALEKSSLRREVASANEAMAELAIKDELTGLYNRRYFEEACERECSRVDRYGTELTLAMVDIDHFKRINDSFGHPVGDRVLTRIGDLLASQTRKTDIACRYGGEEFAILLPDTSLEKAELVFENMRHCIEKSKFEEDGQTIKLTASIGISSYSSLARPTRKALVKSADDGLMDAKEAGRNRIVIAKPPLLAEQRSAAFLAQRGVRILVVDDDEIDRNRIKRFLPAGFEINEASCAREWLDSMTEDVPDCVLVDYKLPDTSGLDIVSQCTSLGIAVLMLTGAGDEVVAVEAIKRGAHDYLVKKNLTEGVLKRAVEDAIRNTRSAAAPV